MGTRIWTYEGDSLSVYHYIAAEAQFKNYWEWTLGVGRNFESFSDRDVRRGGTLIKRPAVWWMFTALSTDSRRRVQLQLNPSWWRTSIYYWEPNRQSYGSNVDLRIRIRLAPNIEFTIGPNYTYGVRDAQWVDLVEKNINGQIKKHYVYGELESQTLDFTTRADISFTPTLSLQLYLQPLLDDRRIYQLQGTRGTKDLSVQIVSPEEKSRLPLPVFARQRRPSLGVPTRKHAIFGLDAIARS